jgi:hypothetical protein
MRCDGSASGVTALLLRCSRLPRRALLLGGHGDASAVKVTLSTLAAAVALTIRLPS